MTITDKKIRSKQEAGMIDRNLFEMRESSWCPIDKLNHAEMYYDAVNWFFKVHLFPHWRLWSFHSSGLSRHRRTNERKPVSGHVNNIAKDFEETKTTVKSIVLSLEVP